MFFFVCKFKYLIKGDKMSNNPNSVIVWGGGGK